MNWLRHHWFDLAPFLAVIILIGLYVFQIQGLSLLLWINMVALLFHQFEEYRYPGYFPGMLNVVMYRSKFPDRFPLNAQTSFIVNVLIGWTTYLLAALYGSYLLWLAIAAILISAGNVIAHCFLFNLKGNTFYNPGQLTSILLFIPISIFFFYFLITRNLGSTFDYFFGISLGVLLNVVGILKTIDWMKDEYSSYPFEQRQLLQ